MQWRKPGSSTQRNPLEKPFQNWRGIWPRRWRGFSVELWDQGKKGWRFGAFGTEFVTKFVPVSGKIWDRIRAAKSRIRASSHPACLFWDCVLSSRPERPSENAFSTQGKNGMNYPKDPAVLKTLRRSKLTTRSKFSIAQWFAIATPSCGHRVPWVLQASLLSKKGSQRSKSGGRSKNIRAGFRQNGFFADFYFWAAEFFRGFSRRIFSPHFCGGKSAQKNPPGKSPAKSSKVYTTKILQHISADCPGQKTLRRRNSLSGSVFSTAGPLGNLSGKHNHKGASAPAQSQYISLLTQRTLPY